MKTAPTIPCSAKAIASVAATQPSVEPRSRYGSMNRMYVAAPTPTQSRRPTTSPSRNRPGDRLVWLIGAVPAATRSVVKTANETRSPKAK